MDAWSGQVINNDDPYFQIGSSYSNGYIISTDQKNLCALESLQKTDAYSSYFMNLLDQVKANDLGLLNSYDPKGDPEDAEAAANVIPGVNVIKTVVKPGIETHKGKDEASCANSRGSPHLINKHFTLLKPYLHKHYNYRGTSLATGDYDKYTTNIINKATQEQHIGTHANMRLRRNPVYKTHYCSKDAVTGDSFTEHYVDFQQKWRSHIKYNKISHNLTYSKERDMNSVEQFEYVKCNSKSNIFKLGKIKNNNIIQFTITKTDTSSNINLPNTLSIIITHSTSLLKLEVTISKIGDDIYKIYNDNVNVTNILSEGIGINTNEKELTFNKDNIYLKDADNRIKYNISNISHDIKIGDIEFKESFSNLKILYKSNSVEQTNEHFKMTKIRKIIKSDTITYYSQKLINQINNNEGIFGNQFINKLTINDCINNINQEIDNINWDLNNLYLRVFPINESISKHYINNELSGTIKKVPRLSTKHIIKTTNLTLPQIYNKFLFTYFKSDNFNIDMTDSSITESIDKSHIDYLSLQPPYNYIFTEINNSNDNVLTNNVISTREILDKLNNDDNYLKYILLNGCNHNFQYITIDGDTNQTKFFIQKLDSIFINKILNPGILSSNSYEHYYLLHISSNRQFLQIYNDLTSNSKNDIIFNFFNSLGNSDCENIGTGDTNNSIEESYTISTSKVFVLHSNEDLTDELNNKIISIDNQITIFKTTIFLSKQILQYQYNTISDNIDEEISYVLANDLVYNQLLVKKKELNQAFEIHIDNLEQIRIETETTDISTVSISQDLEGSENPIVSGKPKSKSKKTKNMMLYIIIGSVVLVLIISLLIYFRSRIFK
jgi:hypothetical protein